MEGGRRDQEDIRGSECTHVGKEYIEEGLGVEGGSPKSMRAGNQVLVNVRWTKGRKEKYRIIIYCLRLFLY